MSYKLDFLAEALKEWKALDASIKEQFKKKLTERLENPFIPAAKLSGSSTGTRLNYGLLDIGWFMR